MNPSRETLTRLEREHGFAAGPLEIVIRLGDLLRAIKEDQLLGGRLILKGGTALNLCFGEPTRLSVDLDFNDIGVSDVRSMQSDRPLVMAALDTISRRGGYRVQRSREEHAGQKLHLSYRSAFGTAARLQIDVNFLHRLPLVPVTSRSIWSFDGEPPEILVVGTSELIAGKMLALLDRCAARDLYDIARLMNRRDVLPVGDMDLARPLFIALSIILPRPLWEYGLDRLSRITDANVRDTLHPLLRSEDRPSARQLLEHAGEFVRPWLQLSEPEVEYVRLAQAGELRPELVFPETPGLVDSLRRHPALLWKTRNALEHAGRRPRKPRSRGRTGR